MKKWTGILLMALLLCLTAFAVADVAIDETTFPDNYFRGNVVKKWDLNEDGVLDESEIAAVTSVKASGVHSFKGIEYLSSLQKLDITRNSLKEPLDVSHNEMLEELYCGQCELTELDVSKNKKLKILDCKYNDLTSLDLSNNPELTKLTCYHNQLTELDLSSNLALEELSCGENMLKTMDLSNHRSLKEYTCQCETLETVNLSCTAVTMNGLRMTLNNGTNYIKDLDLSGCDALWSLTLHKVQNLVNVNLSDCKTLRYLRIVSSEVSNLDLTGCDALETFYCCDAGLKDLTLTGCSSLKELTCYSNSLSSLDVSSCVNLAKMDVRYNKLKALDVTKCVPLNILVNTKPRVRMDYLESVGPYDAFDDLDNYYALYIDTFVTVTAGSKVSKPLGNEETETPTPTLTATPTAKPTATPTAKPTATPTDKPTAKPTATPTAKPTAKPVTSKTVTVKDGKYTVSGKTATFTGPSKKSLTKLVIQNTVKINGKSYKVTAIDKAACKGMSKLTSVTIGSNIKTIGENAFCDCTKLKTITIKTTKLKSDSVAADAFKNTYKRATVICPSSKLSTYRVFLIKCGIAKTAVFKK